MWKVVLIATGEAVAFGLLSWSAVVGFRAIAHTKRAFRSMEEARGGKSLTELVEETIQRIREHGEETRQRIRKNGEETLQRIRENGQATVEGIQRDARRIEDARAS